MYCSSHENHSSFFLGYLPFFLRIEKISQDTPKKKKKKSPDTGHWLRITFKRTSQLRGAFIAKAISHPKYNLRSAIGALKYRRETEFSLKENRDK